MVHRTLAKDISKHIDQTIFLRGWLHQIRAMGKLSFLILRDRSGLAQIVVQDKVEINKLSHLHPGSILTVNGVVQQAPGSSSKVELIHPIIQVDHPILEPPPIEYYKQEIPTDLDFILDNRPIALRNQKLQAVFKIQAELAHAFRLYMHDTIEAVEYFPPNIVGASSEGGAEFFNVDYFGHVGSLAQSSQLYKQIMTGVNERVFALTPFFRAEPSQTSRHLSEGKQFEFEMGFFVSWQELMDVQEGCIKFMIEYLHHHAKEALNLLGNPLIRAPKHVPIPRLTFQEAQQLFFDRTGQDEREELDLSPAAERELCKWASEQFETDLVFITHWQTEKRPFYAQPNEENPKITNTFDLLCGGTEITSGGERRHTLESMIDGIKSKGMDPKSFEDYLSIFRYGMPQHGGFGMGLERLTMTLLGLKNIREASLFPSDPKRIASHRIQAHIFFGGENIRNEIIRLCREKSFTFHHQLQEPSSSPDSLKSIKALILKGKTSKKNYQFNILSDSKLDMKTISEKVGEKCEFEDPQIILERYGLIVGGVPPFGNLLNLDNYFDETILSENRISFSCGLPQEWMSMLTNDLLTLTNPHLGKFTKEGGI